jgi:succinate-acetate transporter protein
MSEDTVALANTRVVLRPIGSPLPLGFLGLFVATLSFSAVQLGWVPQAQGSNVALAALGLTVPVQLLASVFGFLARDPVAGTGMGILAGTWATAGLSTLTSPPGVTSPGLGIVLIGSGLAMFVPAAAGREKTVAATVMAVSGIRFIITGIAEMNGLAGWMTVAGWVGLVLATVSLYAAMAFELEGTDKRAVLPLWRRGDAASAVHDGEAEQLSGVAREPGVRKQL